MAELLYDCDMLTKDNQERLEIFFSNSSFKTRGAVITDLDGTAVHEFQGKTIIHKDVELGLKFIYDVGRPVVINTLRFPLSVIRTFGLDWYKISNNPIPVVLLNGSQLGFISRAGDEFVFEQLKSYPLTTDEIHDVVNKVRGFKGADSDDIILFYYPEDWKKGEIIWTPNAQRIPYLQKKYPSASTVLSIPLPALATELLSGNVCMILLLIDLPADKLMAYQHTKRSNFVTHRGINKLSGAEKIAELLDIDLRHSIGAGDSDMDNFLNAVGLSVHVGNPNLPFLGTTDTIRLATFIEFGNLLYKFAEMQQAVLK